MSHPFSDFLAKKFGGDVRYNGNHRPQDTNRWHCALRGVPPVSDDELTNLVRDYWAEHGKVAREVLSRGHYGIVVDNRLLSLTITNHSDELGLIQVTEEEF